MSEAHDPPAHPKKKSSGALRTLILLGLLLLIVAAGLWDWYGAKEPRDQAYQRVQAVQGSAGLIASTDDPPITQASVQKAVGSKPAETTTENGVIYERYSWRRGIPWMTYDLWVLYRGDESKEMLVAQRGEEGKPDTIYAANSGKGQAPAPDASTDEPNADGESPAPPAEDDAAATPVEGAGDAAAELGDDAAETPPETPDRDVSGGSSDATATEPSEGDASPTESATDKAESESP